MLHNRIAQILLSVSLAVTTFLFVAIPASAASTLGGWDFGYNTLHPDTSTVGVLNSSKLDDESRKLLKQWISNPNMLIVTSSVYGGTAGSSNIFGFFFPIDNYDKNAYSYYQNPGKTSWGIRFLKPRNYLAICFNADGDPIKATILMSTNSCKIGYNDNGKPYTGILSFSSYNASYFDGFWNLITTDYFDSNGLTTPDGAKSCIWEGTLQAKSQGKSVVFQFDDNLGEPDEPEPSEPDTPSSKPTLPPVSYPDYPTIGPNPGDNKYVVYDTTVWNRFSDHIKKNIGSAASVGFIIFAGIFGLYVVKWIINRFAK